MTPTRRIAITTGILFIAATTASLVGAALLPSLNGTEYLAGVAVDQNQATAAALAYLVAAFASVGIAITLYPLIRRVGQGLALGAVVFRALEATMYTVGVVSLLTLLPVSRAFVTAGEDHTLQAIGDTVVKVHDSSAVMAVFAFSAGALLYYYLFFRSRLIPRWLSGWGILAIILILIACVSAVVSGNPVTSYVALAAPIGVQEIVLALWLLIRGFNRTDLDHRAGFGQQEDAPTGRVEVRA